MRREKIIWKRIWARKYSLLMSSYFIEVFQKNSGFDMCKNKLFIPEGNLYAIYFSEKEFEELIKNYTRFLMKQNLANYAKIYEKQFKEFLSWSLMISHKTFSHLTNQKIIELLFELKKKMIQFSEWQFLSFVVLEGPVKAIEQKYIAEKNSSQILEAIVSSYKLTLITKARLELLQLIKSKKVNQKNISHYIKKYKWIPVYEFIDKPWDSQDIFAQIKSIKNASAELEHYYSFRKQISQRYGSFLETISNDYWKKTVEIVHYFSYLKEMRDDYRRHAYFLLRLFWEEVAKRLKVSFESTNYLTTEELAEALKKSEKKFIRIIDDRMKKYAIVLKNGRVKIYSGPVEAEKIVKKSLFTDHASNKCILGGSGAGMGKVSGRVKIIFHAGEFKRFKVGEILVTVMTHPEFLLIMKQAKAIVTDEGGLTCHAAIIAREMQKPCVIGTKIATKVLKDGQLIEVDADKGVVRILE